jgi:hypothetical protein
MNPDLSTINFALVVIAIATAGQLLIVASAVVWARFALNDARRAMQQDLRPVIARLNRALEEIEAAGRGVGAISDDARRALSNVNKAVSAVAPVVAPRTWAAAQVLKLIRARRNRRNGHVEQAAG